MSPRLWCAAMNRWGDQTGVSHLMTERGRFMVPTCGARPFSLGGATRTPQTPPCRRCLRIDERKNRPAKEGR